jgi:outer membrane protein assembly factor BamA
MRKFSSIFTFCLVIFIYGCSNTRFLKKDEILYTGRERVEIINKSNVPKTSSVKNYVESLTNHKVNNSMFGKRLLPPIGLWVHNYIKPGEGNKAGKWLYKTFSSSPILISDVNPSLRASKIESDLFDKGYFRTTAWSEIDTNKRNPHKAKVSYFINLEPPGFYNRVELDSMSDQIDTLISRDDFMIQIRPGNQFNLETLKSSRISMSKRMQDKGYFYFVPELIDLNADTSVAGNMIDLVISKKKDVPLPAFSVYKINNVTVYNSQGTDSSSAIKDTIIYDGIKIISERNILKPDVIVNSIYFRKGDLYSYTVNQSTTARLSNLGVFKYVNISYIQNKSDSLSHLLDVKIDLIMSDNISLDLEADIATKSSGYTGPLFSTSISNGNAFKGAERLRLGLTGGFEWQTGAKSEDQIGTYSYQAGVNTGLTFPEIIIPFNYQKKSSMLLQRTAVNAEASLLNRTAYYKMLSLKTNLNYQWSRNSKIQHSLFPLYFNSVRLLATTADFDSVVGENIYIRKSFEEQFILGSQYEFNFNNTLNIRPNNFLFQGGISVAGNLIDLLKGIEKEPSERPYYFFKNIYSQYVKLTADFRYYRNGFNKSLVFRLYAGIGMPYGNSTALPYVEQFFSGGAYSVRGFTARYLGPGSFHTDDQSGYIDQSGDIKLESNLEFRFDMSKMLKGAIYVETGNIWLVNEDPNRPGAKLDFHTFYDQLAVGTGFGLRFDFSFFVLRADMGFPLRTPYLTGNRNWLFGTDRILSGGLFYLAIGYPF